MAVCTVHEARGSPTDLNKVHQDELPSQQTAHVDVSEGSRQVLWLAGLVEEHLGLHNLLHQDTSCAKHSPTSVLQLSLTVPTQSNGVSAQAQRVPPCVNNQKGLRDGLPLLPSRIMLARAVPGLMRFPTEK